MWDTKLKSNKTNNLFKYKLLSFVLYINVSLKKMCTFISCI